MEVAAAVMVAVTVEVAVAVCVGLGVWVGVRVGVKVGRCVNVAVAVARKGVAVVVGSRVAAAGAVAGRPQAASRRMSRGVATFRIIFRTGGISILLPGGDQGDIIQVEAGGIGGVGGAFEGNAYGLVLPRVEVDEGNFAQHPLILGGKSVVK